MNPQVLYQYTPGARCIKSWLKQVHCVRPLQGNGFDICGPFIRSTGMLPEGTLLCSGETYAPDRHAVIIYRALQVTTAPTMRVHAHNLQELTNSAMITSFEQKEEAVKAFPELRHVAHLPILRVLWVLLHTMKQHEAPTHTPTRFFDLEES